MKMKKLNLVFLILGVIYVALPLIYNVDGTLGFLSVWLGVMFIGIGIFKDNKPKKVIYVILDFLDLLF